MTLWRPLCLVHDSCRVSLSVFMVLAQWQITSWKLSELCRNTVHVFPLFFCAFFWQCFLLLLLAALSYHAADVFCLLSPLVYDLSCWPNLSLALAMKLMRLLLFGKWGADKRQLWRPLLGYICFIFGVCSCCCCCYFAYQHKILLLRLFFSLAVKKHFGFVFFMVAACHLMNPANFLCTLIYLWFCAWHICEHYGSFISSSDVALISFYNLLHQSTMLMNVEELIHI